MTHVCVVGIGADGWDGLSTVAKTELGSAATIYGSRRQLDYLPDDLAGTRIAWSTPMSAHLRELLNDLATTSTPVHVLASGDPMFHGVGTTIVQTLGPEQVRVIPSVSSASLAVARLGWNLASTQIQSVVNGPIEAVVPHLSDGVRLLVLSRDGDTPAQVATLLCDNGFGWSSMTVLGSLGGPDESRRAGIARTWDATPCPPLNILAVHCVGPTASRQSGLEDSVYSGDGQLTKQAVRALTLSALAPAPGQLLWDVGAGSGSIAIEWCRAESSCTAMAFESDVDRQATISTNARTLGVTGIRVRGRAPESLDSAPDPDAIFIGGGLNTALIEQCWDSLLEGGRMVVNAVTWESEALVRHAYSRFGGRLRRCQIDHAEPLGTMTTWRAQLPIVQWIVTKPKFDTP